MTVKELAMKTGSAPTTLYSIIQRDAAIRFDTALRISNILDIPKDCLMVGMEKKAYYSSVEKESQQSGTKKCLKRIIL